MRIAIWIFGAALILIPALATALTDEMNWGFEDFAFAAVVAVILVAGFEFSTRKIKNRTYRTLTVALLIGVLALLWAHMAVGIFPTS